MKAIRKRFAYDVFLSYTSKDKPAVRELAERLKQDGLRVWFDEWVVQPGDLISLKIEQGLEQSRTLILVMSQNAFAQFISVCSAYNRTEARCISSAVQGSSPAKT